MGLVEDRDTDGHVDLIASFIAPGQVLLQTVGPDNPNYEDCRRTAPGCRRRDHGRAPVPPYDKVAGETIAASYLNFYIATAR